MSLYSSKVHTVPGGTELTIENGGEVNVEAGGQIVAPTSAASTGVTLPNYGLSTIARAATHKAFVLAAPRAGVVKTIWQTSAASTKYTNVFAGTGVLFTSTANSNYLRFKDADSVVLLHGLTTASWLVLFKSTGITPNDTAST